MSTSTAGVHVPYGTVTDTTADPRWVPVTVTAHLAEPVARLGTYTACLDGPLAWCAAEHHITAGTTMSPIRDDWAPDMQLPLATWTAPDTRTGPAQDPRLCAEDPDHVWGWAVSAAVYDVDQHTSLQIRRRPAVEEFARFSTDRKYHPGLGPTKARDGVVPATLTREITWYALGDPDGITDLLHHLRYLGAVRRHGHGRITRITIQRGDDRDAWRNRPMPHPNGHVDAIRAPHWHHSRHMPCTWGTTP